jgi:hypothetical protein
LFLTAPRVCAIKCASGVADFAKCKCIQCGPEYEDLVRTLNSAKATLKKSGQPTKAITDAVNDIDKDLVKIQAYCVKTDGKIDKAYIDGEMSYTRKKVIALTANVKKLQSDLSAQSCPGVKCESGYTVSPDDCGCSCQLNCPRGNVYNWGKCTCSPYADMDIAYDLRTTVSTLVRRINECFTDSTKVSEYLEKIYKFQDGFNNAVGECEYNFETQNLVETTKKFKDFETECKKIQKEFDDYEISTRVCSSTQCDNPTLLVKGCTCDEGAEISKYYELRDEFIVVEEKVRTFSNIGAGTPEHKGFIQESTAIRTLIQKYREYLINNPGAYNKYKYSNNNPFNIH